MSTDALDSLPAAPEYRIANALMQHLGADAALAPYLYPQLWDRHDQAQALAAAALLPRGLVAVAPQPPRPLPADPNNTTGVLQAQVCVCVLTLQGATGGTTAAAAAALLAQTLRAVLSFEVDSAGIPYARQTVTAVGALNAADFPELKNLAGMVIQVSVPLNYLKS